MRLSKPVNSVCVLTMTALMSNLPNVALAEKIASENMVTASAVLADITREEAEKNVQEYLQRSDVQAELIKHGVSAEEAAIRLASLSEAEVKQLSNQAKKAQAGGDILITVLLIVLIIFLIKRI